MNKTTIHCRMTASMFIAGVEKRKNAQGRDEAIPEPPELRAAGIKGCMRFIWRALQRAEDIGALRKREGELFGNAFGDNATRASGMRMRIANFQKMSEYGIGEHYEKMAPHREDPNYVGPNKDKPLRVLALKNGGTFDVIITSFCRIETHIKYVRLFTLTCLLYGFGRRSRKGFGTVVVTGVDGDGREIDWTFDGIVKSLKALSEFGADYSWLNDLEISAGGGGAADYPYIENIRIAGSKTFVSTDGIIKQIGMAVHNAAAPPAVDPVFLGSHNPRSRFASSVLLSTVPWGVDGQRKDEYCCIATQLHCTKAFNPTNRTDFYVDLDGRV